MTAAMDMCEQVKAGLQKMGGQHLVLKCMLLKTADRWWHAGSNLAGSHHVNQWDSEENLTKKAQGHGLQQRSMRQNLNAVYRYAKQDQTKETASDALTQQYHNGLSMHL